MKQELIDLIIAVEKEMNAIFEKIQANPELSFKSDDKKCIEYANFLNLLLVKYNKIVN